jgi:hypothetical protein
LHPLYGILISASGRSRAGSFKGMRPG